MTYPLRTILPFAALIAVLAMSPVAPEASNVIFLALGAFSILLMVPRGHKQFQRPIIWMPLLAMLLIAIAYGVGAKSVEGLVGLAYFAPVFAIWPMLNAAEDMKGLELPGLVGMLGLVGAAGAAIIVILEVSVSGNPRGGGTVANPIHFADVVLLVGFTACAGLIAKTGWSRLFFLVAPLLATVAVILSGTRGAVVAIAVMIVVAGVMLVALRLVSWRSTMLAMAVLIVVGVIAAFLGASQLSGVQRVLIDMRDVLNGSLPTDEATAIRLQMLTGGLRAFLEAPIFGHGPLNFVNVANVSATVSFEGAPHLHNDIVDFAASAGTVGLVAYALLLLAPIVEVVRAGKSWGRPRILVLVSSLMAGFFVMGLTNAMFGILAVTTTYAAICVVAGILVAQANAASDVSTAA